MSDFLPSGIRGRIVGNVVAPAEEKFEGRVVELRVAVGHGFKDKQTGEWKDTGTTWVTYSASGDWGENLKQFNKGDRIQIDDAAIETRTYQKRDGGEGLAVNARFGEISLLESKKVAEPAW